MENDDLAKKLEKISLPEIELQSHKTKLRLLLMEKYSPEKKRREIFGILNKLIPATAFAIILLFIFFNKRGFQTDNLARAKEIALQNTEIKNWVEEGATIKDVQIVDGKAYVLIEPAETAEVSVIKETSEEPPAVNLKSGGTFQENVETKESFKGAVAEVNIKEKKISNIEKLAPTVTGLIEKKKEKTLEIANNSTKIQEVVPKEAEVLDISVTVPKFKLSKEGGSILVLPETETEERASIIYKSDGKRWEGKINLNKEEVEEVKSIKDINNSATPENPGR